MTKSAKNITTVTHRRHEFFVLRRRLRFHLFCFHCATDKEFFPLDEAVWFSGLTMREMARRIETSDIHFLETAEGHLFVCRQWLAANARKPVAEITRLADSGEQN